MNEPICFSKIEFYESIGYGQRSSIILLNLVQQELSYQVFRCKHQRATAIEGIKTDSRAWNDEWYSYRFRTPAVFVANEHSDFSRKLIKLDEYEDELIFSHGIKLSDEQMAELLPLCYAKDFEPYRNRKMEMYEEGYCGYRDEAQVYFTGITDSYIPMIELPMMYFYDEEHIWPSEKLYRHIITKIFDKEKCLKKWYTTYYGFSLLF